MFSKRVFDRFVTPLVIGAAILFLVGDRAISGEFGPHHTLGLLVGLLCGLLSLCFFELRLRRPESRPRSTILALLFSPVLAPFLFFWPPFAAGYIFGSFAMFALGLALANFLELL